MEQAQLIERAAADKRRQELTNNFAIDKANILKDLDNIQLEKEATIAKEQYLKDTLEKLKEDSTTNLSNVKSINKTIASVQLELNELAKKKMEMDLIISQLNSDIDLVEFNFQENITKVNKDVSSLNTAYNNAIKTVQESYNSAVFDLDRKIAVLKQQNDSLDSEFVAKYLNTLKEGFDNIKYKIAGTPLEPFLGNRISQTQQEIDRCIANNNTHYVFNSEQLMFILLIILMIVISIIIHKTFIVKSNPAIMEAIESSVV